MTAENSGYATGTVEIVSYQDNRLGPADPSGIELLYTITEFQYTGGMDGRGYHVYIQRVHSDTGPFRVMARVVGSLGGRSGTFVTEGTGTRRPTGPVDVDWHIVEGSGTGELTGATGSGTVTTTDDGVVRYTLSYQLPQGRSTVTSSWGGG
ncbi:Protein of unknown function [Amycolatopsis marina]|uniref:Allene oxide cyclase barrel-like domain-containing protein n=1 Tax=Amycolatopsis marina TaxID=490629 RepID=A0A1I0ZJQ0_9PSEU|nr:DUF3224 domain-containing protein [Amycolatopsis marina]SFB25751.1 Protein of unknown function [Amycolatopsis marina]